MTTHPSQPGNHGLARSARSRASEARPSRRWHLSPVWIAGLCVFAVVEAHAAKIGWHPDLVVSLGRGIDLRNQDTIKPPVAMLSAMPAADPSTGDAALQVRYAEHQFDLAKSFGLNASLSAKNKMYEGSVKFGMVDSFKSSGNTISFALEGNRNFGDRLYSAIGLDTNFVAVVNELQQVLSGAMLHKAITDRFGAHFVSGYQRAAKVVLLYTLTYESQATARSRSLDFGLKYSDGVTSAKFTADVKSEMSRADSHVSIDYQFYSTDPLQLPDFPLTARIATFDDFLAHSAKVEAYCKTMNPDHAKDIAYIVEPIENLPGYLQLLGGFRPEAYFNTSYDRFLTTYATFKGWDDLLDTFAGDARHMSWLNDEGQKILLDTRGDVIRALRHLEDLARSHFHDGTPLEIGDDIANYRANFNRIPLPSMNSVRHVVANDTWDYVIGFVNCGPKELVRDFPFAQCYVLDETGADVRAVDLIPDTARFEQDVRAFVAGLPVFAGVEGLFATPLWSQIKAVSASNRILFYQIWPPGVTPFESRNWSLALKDASGAVAFSMKAGFMNADLTTRSLEASRTASVSLATVQTPEAAPRVGLAVTRVLRVSNDGPGAAYGVSVTLSLPDGFEFGTVQGSQGSASITNRTLRYEVGSLGNGGTADLKVGLIPLRAGSVALAEPLELKIGNGLTDPNPADNALTLRPLEVAGSQVEIARQRGLVEVSWHSDSDQLGLEQASALEPAASWSKVQATPVIDGKRRSVQVVTNAQRAFFRLHLR